MPDVALAPEERIAGLLKANARQVVPIDQLLKDLAHARRVIAGLRAEASG